VGKVIRRGLIANRIRFVLTAVAVILGVAFMSGTSVFTATLQRTFEDLFAGIYAGTDAAVRAPEVLKSSFSGSERPNLPESVLGTVRSVPSVAQAAGAINQGNSYAQLVGSDGRAVTAAGPTFGIGWLPPKLNPWTIAQGRPPEQANEIVVDRRTFGRSGVKLGDRVRVLTAIGSEQYRLVGTAAFGDADSLAGSSVVLFTTPEAQRVNNSIGEFGLIVAAARPGVSEEDLRDDIAAALDATRRDTKLEVVTGAQITDESQQELRNALGFIDIALGVFAAVALAVGAFIIFNTFSIVVAQRTREMALLRALGASRRQVLGQVFGESLVVGVLASAVGVAVGVALSVGLRALLGTIGFELPGAGLVVPSSAIVTGLVVGTLITVASAIVPARQASRIPPIAALRATAVETRSRTGLRLAIGLLGLGGGLAALATGLFGGVENAINLVGTGAALVFLGTFVLAPLFAAPFVRFIAWPLPRLRGIPGRLARENAARNPKRTATTATSLLIGVALVGFITIFAASTKASIGQVLEDQFSADFIISGGSGFGPPRPISPVLADEVAALPAVGASSGLRFGTASIEGKAEFVNGIDPRAAVTVLDLGDVEGSFADLTDEGIGVSQRKADENGWSVGDTVPIEFVATGVQPVRVQFVYAETTFGDYFISLGSWDRNFVQRVDNLIFAKLKPGESADAGREAIEKLLVDYPSATLRDNAEYRAEQEAQVDQLVRIVYALLLMALVIALIGIANTLALSIYERTRELGLLRAVGMSRAQIRSAVRWESVLISLLGALLGLAIGLLFGWSVVRALRDEGFSSFAIAPGQLLSVVVVLAVASVGAAILPARRASRIDVLEAISTE